MIGKIFAFLAGFFMGSIFGGVVVKLLMERLLQGGII